MAFEVFGFLMAIAVLIHIRYPARSLLSLGIAFLSLWFLTSDLIVRMSLLGAVADTVQGIGDVGGGVGVAVLFFELALYLFRPEGPGRRRWNEALRRHRERASPAPSADLGTRLSPANLKRAP